MNADFEPLTLAVDEREARKFEAAARREIRLLIKYGHIERLRRVIEYAEQHLTEHEAAS